MALINRKRPAVDDEVNEATNAADKLSTERNPALYVLLKRSKTVEKMRMKLPIMGLEYDIMHNINNNNIVIVSGETGSGKTTQIPQFLYEAGYTERNHKLIGITEPRRVAAISMSKRVAEEMNLTNGEVSYLIRFEGNVTDRTKIKFMTDGVLMKEFLSDCLLSKYSVIILDEAHERSVYTDILIGILSRVVPARAKRNDPLKLIIMSATLCVDHFIKNTNLFQKIKPPVISVESRQFKVTVHFNRTTNPNYLAEAYKKVCKIHSKLPRGGILVFVTGQAEVKYLVRKLKSAFPFSNNSDKSNSSVKKKNQKCLPQIDLSRYALPGEDDSDSDLEDVYEDEDATVENEEDSDNGSDFGSDSCDEIDEPLWVIPLYSMLSSHEQNKVFQPAPENSRFCVISTNVAETSLTIPGIKYIVDTGKVKIKLYDKVTGASKFQIGWITKANAEQRAGRAGRTGPGHCYRLYSSAVFQNEFETFPLSEIEQKPIDDVVLQLKMLHIDNIVNFPFPTPPSLDQLESAEKHLKLLEILDEKTARVTGLGRKVSQFPVTPRFGKMLVFGNDNDILEYVIIIVAALSVPVLFELDAIDSETCLEHRVIAGPKGSHGRKLGDPMLLLKMVGAGELAHSKGELKQFCTENHIRYKAFMEIRKLRHQLTEIAKKTFSKSSITVDPLLLPPNEIKARLLRQVILASSVDKIARKIQTNDAKKEDRIKLKYGYQTLDLEDPVYMHTDCVLIKQLPEYVCYQELYETSKLFMRNVTQIELEWIPVYASKICSIPKPISNSEKYNEELGKIMCRSTGFFGRRNWPLPIIEVEHPTNLSLYKKFAMFLLEGKVFRDLEKFTPHLLSSPAILDKTWVKLHPKTEKFIKALISNIGDSKHSLQTIWQTQPTYLLDEYLMWLPKNQHEDLKSIWPPKK